MAYDCSSICYFRFSFDVQLVHDLRIFLEETRHHINAGVLYYFSSNEDNKAANGSTPGFINYNFSVFFCATYLWGFFFVLFNIFLLLAYLISFIISKKRLSIAFIRRVFIIGGILLFLFLMYSFYRIKDSMRRIHVRCRESSNNDVSIQYK